MNTYRIADITVKMKCWDSPLKRQAKAYQIGTLALRDIPDMIIDIDREKPKHIQKKYPEMTLGELEYIYTGFVFYHRLLDFDGFCLHSSAVAMENRAVLFSGPCGTGKSTHAALWQQYFGAQRALIVNDDKPALRLIEDAFYVYGTPWSGKSNLNMNICVPLGAIVFLKQSEENHIRRLGNKEAIKMLVYQSLRPNTDADKVSKLLTLLDVLLKKIPVYEMGCTISFEAVKLVYDKIVSDLYTKKQLPL